MGDTRHISTGVRGISKVLLLCLCVVAAPAILGFFLGCPQTAASFPPGIFQEEVSKAVRGWPISAGLTPIRGKGCCRYGPTANPAKPVPLLPNDFLKVFLAACKLQEKLFLLPRTLWPLFQLLGMGRCRLSMAVVAGTALSPHSGL